MAAYREHLAFSTLIGIGYGAGATMSMGFTPVQGALAGTLTAVGGMLPDLDAQNGTPVRELTGIAAAIVPLVLAQQLLSWGGHPERIMLLAVTLYFFVRYGGALLLSRLTVHRGMFHSIPAALIAGGCAFLLYVSENLFVRALMGGGIAIGFLSHLLLDEIYSVQWNGVRVRLKKSAGSALKLVGRNFAPNLVTYGLLFAVGYVCLQETTDYLERNPVRTQQKLTDAPKFDPERPLPKVDAFPEPPIRTADPGDVQFGEEGTLWR